MTTTTTSSNERRQNGRRLAGSLARACARARRLLTTAGGYATRKAPVDGLQARLRVFKRVNNAPQLCRRRRRLRDLGDNR